MKTNITTLLLPMFLIGAVATTRAATIAATFTSGSTPTASHAGNGSTTLGWTFTANNNIFVTALGYYDKESDGLSESHDVGIFASNGTLLFSATVPSGTSASIVDRFRYVSVAPFSLAAGTTYTIGATMGALASDTVENGVNGLISDPAITISSTASRYTDVGSYTSLTYPNQHFIYNFYAGPNFQSQPVPEPSSILMLTAGATGLLSITRRRKPQTGKQSERNG